MKLELIFLQEKEKMKVLEEKLSEVKKHQSATGHPDELLRDGGRSKNLVGLDFIGETESEDESLNEELELNSELDARLSRLALLDQTQQEIDQISVATESMLQQSKICSPYWFSNFTIWIPNFSLSPFIKNDLIINASTK